MAREIILKPKEDNTATFSVRVDRNLLSRFDALSAASGYSRNELIGIAMKEYADNVKLVAEPDHVYQKRGSLQKKEGGRKKKEP